jgi:PmbA protein
LAADPRITNSDGGSFDAATGRKVLANSRGFVGGYRTSYAGVSAAPLAMDANGQMQRDGWWSSARRLAISNRPSPSARKRRGAPCAAWARAAYPRSGFPSSLRRRWRGR